MPTLNFDKIPKHVAERIARDTLEAVQRFIAKPGGAEFLAAQAEKFRKMDEEKAAREAAEKEALEGGCNDQPV